MMQKECCHCGPEAVSKPGTLWHHFALFWSCLTWRQSAVARLLCECKGKELDGGVQAKDSSVPSWHLHLNSHLMWRETRILLSSSLCVSLPWLEHEYVCHSLSSGLKLVSDTLPLVERLFNYLRSQCLNPANYWYIFLLNYAYEGLSLCVQGFSPFWHCAVCSRQSELQNSPEIWASRHHSFVKAGSLCHFRL